MNKKFTYSVGVLLAVLIFACSSQLYGEQEQDKELKVSRSENVPGAFEDLSLDNLVDTLTKRKLNAKADIVIKLGKSKPRTQREARVIKNKIKAANHKAQKTYNSQKSYKKVSKVVGGVGKALAVYDAYQNAYVVGKDGKKVFSKTKFFKNSVMNLSGLAGVSAVYTKGMEAKEKAFLKYLDEYEKAGKDITDPKYIYKALARATGDALLVGAYEGAKCIPLAGDAINVYELTEATVGLVHDTNQLKKTKKENKDEQERQTGASIAKFKRLLRQAKSCRTLYDKQEKYANDLTGQFKKIRNQYITVQNRDVKRTEQLPDSDKLEKNCKVAKPFLDDKYLQGLKDNSAEMDRVVGVTLKLAETSLEHYLKNPDPAPLKKTSNELSDMLKTMLGYKEECEKIVTVLQPVLGGNNVLDQSQALGDAANNDAIISSNLMQNATDLVKLHRSMVQKCQKLQTAQQKIKIQFDNAFNYFSIHAKDSAQNKEICDLKNKLIGVMIQDYMLKKLKDNALALGRDLNSWNKPIQAPEGMNPELAEIIAKASQIQPEIANLRDSLATRIEEAKAMIDRLNNPGEEKENLPDYTVKKVPKLSNNQLANISTDDICNKANYVHQFTGNGKVNFNRTACGFKYHKMNFKEFEANIKNPHVKSIPYFYGGFRKLLEKGTAVVWQDLNGNGKKDGNEWRKEPYWIWYETLSGCYLHMDWSYWKDERASKEVQKKQKDYNRTHAFIAPNVEKGFIGIKEGTSTGYDNNIFKYKQYWGFAMYPPFQAGVSLRIVAQFGPYQHIPSSGFIDEKFQVWQYLKNPDQMKKKVASYEKGIEKQIKEMLNESLTLPKQFMDYSEENFYMDICEIFPNGKLEGFKTNKYFKKKENNQSIRLSKEKSWKWGTRKARIRYSIDAYVGFPDRDESWNQFLKRFPQEVKKRQSLNINQKILNTNLQGADFVKAKCEQSERKYTNRKTQTKYSVYSRSEYISFIKSNIQCEVDGHGNNLPDPKLETQSISQRILNKVKK